MRNNELDFFNIEVNQIADDFQRWLYPSTYENVTSNDFPLKKNIYSDSLNLLSYDNAEYKHNCIPCNLKDGANLINQFLSNHRDCTSIRYYLSLYSLLFYLQTERCAVVYVQLGYTHKNNPKEFDWEQFPILQKIKYWANFFKHPKSAMFIHHPTFHIESYDDNPNFRLDGIIDSDFVKKYYSGGKKNPELKKKLLNNDFKVFFPDLVVFTKELCDEFEKLIQTINSNPENVEKLKIFRKDTH